MLCDYIQLSNSIHGSIIKCKRCEDKVAFMFNNITQTFGLEQFYDLKNFIDNVKVEKFFKDYPGEERIHIRTEQKNLFFSFTQNEIYELRALMSEAHLKMTLYEAIKKNIN